MSDGSLSQPYIEESCGRLPPCWMERSNPASIPARDDVDLNIDLTKIPFPNSTFNAIICNHVLEHIPNDRAAMAELFRVLKPNGWAILQVPISLCLAATYEDFSI